MVARLKDGTLTRPATLEDIPTIVEMTNAALTADVGSGALTVTQLSEEYQQSFFDIERDTRLIFDGAGTLVAAGEFWSREPYVYPYFWGTVHPDYRGRGYGTHLCDWAEGRAQHNLAQAPPDARVAVRCNAVSTNEAARALFEGRGMTVARHFWRMQITMDPAEAPQPVWSEGVRMRTHVAGQDDRRVWEVLEDSFADHWGFTPSPFEHFYEGMIAVESFDPSLWFLAVADTPDGEEIVGVSLCRLGTSDDPDQGFVLDLGVLRDWRRRGIALALLHETFREFHRRGTYRVGLGVDASSLTGATRLYEKAGMSILRQSDLYELQLRDGRQLDTTTLD
jgi:mycothiol synthase